ncbi:MAG TPA: acetyltransferase [Bryobacteraceae bacterium]
MQGSGPGNLVRTFSTDEAVLDAGENRKDLPCTVTPVKPVLGFDLRFHAGFEITLPLKELAGSEDLLTIIFRVTPDADKDSPIYFSQRYTVPKIEDDAKGDAYLSGNFDAGEGKYHIDWLMRDRAERVCSSSWDAEATVNPKDKQGDLSVPANAILASDNELFREEPPVRRASSDGALNVKVMVNFAAQRASSATLRPLDTSALVSILRNISREPRICKFSIVAFNMTEQRVLYRQDNADQIDFPALGNAVQSLAPGRVDFKKLAVKNSETDFLTSLLQSELKHGQGQGKDEEPDAVILAGPKVMLDEGVPTDSLKALENIDFPVFYMNYNLEPQRNPWRDAIGNAVKKLRGYEYTISRPKDLWTAWSDIMSRIVKLKPGRQVTASSQ